VCPTGAIQIEDNEFWIDPALCNNCQGYEEPQCVSICAIATPPVPLKAKKGRCKTNSQVITSPQLFPNGKTSSFASAIVIWEASNALAQRDSLSWMVDEAGDLCHLWQVGGGRGEVTLRIANSSDPQHPPVALRAEPAKAEIAEWDIRATCLHLIFAAHATFLERPWEETFTISDQQISEYLGLDKRKDLSKLAKLNLIKDMARQICTLLVSVNWSPQGRIRTISIPQNYLWHLVEIRHHFQADELGCKHLSGLTLTVQPGQWTQYFLNQQGSREGTTFYQYGTLPKSLLMNVMSIWQQHEGAARIMLWLLFKTRMGSEQRITVPTLMRIGYGEDKLVQAAANREERKRLVRAFESDLEILNRYYLKPDFDPVTYPPDIQPLWAKLADLPDDAEAALEFWTSDGSRDVRLTDAAPRDKWHRLMHARILSFQLPNDWENKPTKPARKKTKKNQKSRSLLPLSGQQISNARKTLQLSQRELANQLGKSQSWVRDIENGRLQVNEKDRSLLSELLGLLSSSS
jgi:DNA-binding transcriptional regulator YiaG